MYGSGLAVYCQVEFRGGVECSLYWFMNVA